MNKILKKWTKFIEEFSYQEMGSWPKGTKLGFFFVGAVIYVGLAYVFVFMPKIQQLKAAMREETVLLVSFEKKYVQYVKILAIKKSMEKETAKLEKYIAKIPEQIDLPQLLEDISVLASKYEVVLQSIRVQPQTKKSLFVEVPIEMRAQGHYHQLATFMNALIQLPYLITFQNTMLSQERMSKESMALVLNLTLKIYQHTFKIEDPK